MSTASTRAAYRSAALSPSVVIMASFLNPLSALTPKNLVSARRCPLYVIIRSIASSRNRLIYIENRVWAAACAATRRRLAAGRYSAPHHTDDDGERPRPVGQ